MGTFERKRLDGKTVPAGAGGGGGCLLIIGIPFLATGLGLLFMTSIGGEPVEEAEHRITFALGGAAFLATGLLVFLAGARLLAAARYRKRQKKEHPDEPWMWDYMWDPKGAQYSAGGLTTKGFAGLIFVTIFLAPFNWLVWVERVWPGIVFLGIFDLLLVAGWVTWVYQTLQGLKFGDSRIAFHRFPYFVGESLDVALLDTDRLRGLTRLTATLRCLEQVVERSGNATTLIMYGVYEDQVEFGPENIYFGTGGAAGILKLSRRSDPLAKLELSFQLPGKDLSTRLLGETEPRFWELEVSADLPGVDYKVQFLLPVYSRGQTGRG